MKNLQKQWGITTIRWPELALHDNKKTPGCINSSGDRRQVMDALPPKRHWGR